MSEKMKHDRQFSIPDPSKPSNRRKRGRIFIDCFGDGDYVLSVNGKDVHFEWSERFGPLPVTKEGRERDLSWRHPFWLVASWWNIQGQRVENGRAIWHVPKPPEYERQQLGARSYLIIRVISDGEPGWDWAETAAQRRVRP